MIRVIVRVGVGVVVVGTWGVIAACGNFGLGHSWIVPVPQINCLVVGTRVTPSRSPIIYFHLAAD